MKLADGTVAKYIGVQVDVTRKTEGSCSAFADGAVLCVLHPLVVSHSCACCMAGTGLPLLIKYDSRLKAQAESSLGAVQEVCHAHTCSMPAAVTDPHAPAWMPLSCAQVVRADSAPVPPLPPSRAGLDLATTLERIQQSFVISDPNLPDCPIVFASDNFIEFTGCAAGLARA